MASGDRTNERRDAPPMTGMATRAAHGMILTVAAKGVRTVVGLTVGVLLARRLGPDAYGVMGLVAAVTGFLTVVGTLGLSVATIQKAELEDDDVNTAFWFQLMVSSVVTLVALGLAPGVARFYNDAHVGFALAAMAPMFLVQGATEQPEALLRRKMAFAPMAACEIGAVMTAAFIALALAYRGAGYWALVAQQLLQVGLLSIGYWAACGWRPGRPRIGASIRGYLDFSLPLFALQILESMARLADRAILGAHFGRREVGLYERSSTIVSAPMGQLAYPLSVVMLPALSALQDKRDAFNDMFLKGLLILTWLVFPLAGGLAGSAYDLIPLLLGDDWSDAATIFSYASLGAALIPLMVTRKWVLVALGKTRVLLAMGAISSVLLLLMVVVSAPYGAESVALARTIWAAIAVVASVGYTIHVAGIPAHRVIRQGLAPALSGLTAASLGLGLHYVDWSSPPVRLLTMVAGTIAASAGLMLLSGDYIIVVAQAKQALRRFRPS